MTEEEIVDLLHFASNYDHRHLADSEGRPSPEIAAWHRALSRLDLDEAMAAVAEHYSASERRVMPSDVMNRCRPPASRLPSSVPVPARMDIEQGVTVIGAERMRQAVRKAEAANQARRDRVLRCPDLAARLCEAPLSFPDPGMWNGYVPPAELQDEVPEAVHSSAGVPNSRGRRTGPRERNDSARRAALVDICAEAMRRERAREAGGAA